MCVMSAVHDHFQPLIPKPLDWPFAPMPGATPGVFTSPSWATAEQVETLRQEVAALRQIIVDFREATKAAAIVDRLTRQPDCVDPEKAKLEERVRELEAKLAAVSVAIGAAP